MAKPRVLVVDDEKLIRWSTQSKLKSWGYEPATADTGEAALKAVRSESFDLVILDLGLPDASGLEMVHRLRRVDPDLPILVATANTSVDLAIQAVKEGVYDYLIKPLDLEVLEARVQKALEMAALRREVHELRSQQAGDNSFDSLIGQSPKMHEALSLARKVANSQATTVLLQGESGTGKDHLARAIHYEGDRRHRHFVEITCTALPGELLETELFGHEKGAFTDATQAKRGLFDVADGGTVFLNEIGATDGNIQGKLLSVIEHKQFRTVGGARTISVDVRIIAATNRDLAEAAKNDEFREDLYFRLQVFPIHLPPLREREGDILLLANYFLNVYNEEFGRSLRGFSQGAEDKLQAYAWPGNVRELKNVVERAAILLDDADYVPAELVPSSSRPDPGDGDRETARLVNLPPGGAPLEEIEEAAIAQALEQSHWSQVEAAKKLGIGRDALRYRMKKFGYLD